MTTPLRGRLLDRYQYPRVLWPLLAAHLGFLGLLVAGVDRGVPLPALFALALLAATTVPPIGIITRVTLRARTSGDVRITALTSDTVLTDVGFMVGPVLAIGIGHATAPVAGLAICALLMMIAVPLMLRGARGGSAPRPPAARHWAGPLRQATSRWVFLVAACFFFGVHAMETALASYGSGDEVTLAGGAALSIIAAGSVLGGIVVGGLPPTRSRRLMRPTVVLSTMAGAMFLLAMLLAVDPLLGYLACVPVGLCLGPSLAAIFNATGDAAAPGEEAESQSWAASALMAGAALGVAAGGWGVQRYGLAVPLVMAGAMTAVGALAGTRLPAAPTATSPGGPADQGVRPKVIR